MGCDIHLYREKFVNNKWESADNWTVDEYDPTRLVVDYDNRAFTGRNYQLFGTLAEGVRTEIPFAFKLRGLPFDITEKVQNEANNWNGDGHSHSYLFLHELKSFVQFIQTKTIVISGQKDSESLKTFRDSIASGTPDWNLLYPYCKWTNQKGFEEFSIEVPADFVIGTYGLNTIIGSFNNIDGENHRIVFWFDN